MTNPLRYKHPDERVQKLANIDLVSPPIALHPAVRERLRGELDKRILAYDQLDTLDEFKRNQGMVLALRTALGMPEKIEKEVTEAREKVNNER